MSSPDLFISAFRVRADSQFAMVASRDFYEVHKLVYNLFPGNRAATVARVLFRFDVEGEDGWLYIQSTKEPDWSRLSDRMRKYVVGTQPLQIPSDERLRFRLLARPSYRVGDKESSLLAKRLSLVREDQQREWLNRKGEAAGFAVEQCNLSDWVWFDSKRDERLPDGSPKPLVGTLFDGILRVVDRDALRQAIARGIGTQKAYGFGLLSVACLPAELRSQEP